MLANGTRTWSLSVVAVVIGVLVFAGASPASAQTTHRPVADFITPNLSGSAIVWGVPGETTWAYVDYFGRFNSQYFLNLGTTVDGVITERRMRDGRALVHVVLHTSNAYTYAYDAAAPGPFADQLVFGHTVGEVQGGAEAGIGDVLLKVDFINSAPGDPLPSLLQLSFGPPPGVELKSLGVIATAEGPLRELFGEPDGTPGMLQVTQRSVSVKGLPNNGQDPWPAEHLHIRPLGN